MNRASGTGHSASLRLIVHEPVIDQDVIASALGPRVQPHDSVNGETRVSCPARIGRHRHDRRLIPVNIGAALPGRRKCLCDHHILCRGTRIAVGEDRQMRLQARQQFRCHAEHGAEFVGAGELRTGRRIIAARGGIAGGDDARPGRGATGQAPFDDGCCHRGSRGGSAPA